MSISMLTLYIFVRQTNLMETQNHMGIMPYLVFDTSQNGEINTFSIDLVNYGVGPAIIESTVILFNGKSYEMKLEEFFRENIPEMERDSVIVTSYSSIRAGVAIPINGRRNIMTVGGGEKSYKKFLGIFYSIQSQKFEYQIKYKSIYDDYWKITSKTNAPELIEQ